jgi:hypothetical protein
MNPLTRVRSQVRTLVRAISFVCRDAHISDDSLDSVWSASLCQTRALGVLMKDADHCEVQHYQLSRSQAPTAARELKLGRVMFDHQLTDGFVY